MDSLGSDDNVNDFVERKFGFRIGSHDSPRGHKPEPKNRYQDQLQALHKKKLIEKRQAERSLDRDINRVNKINKKRYFKPNEVIQSAFLFNRLKPEERMRQSAERLLLGHKISKSLNKTLEQTDVWSKNNFVFKLTGSGHKADKCIERKYYQKSPVRRKLTLVDKMGHDPLTTIRDVSDTFSQVAGSFKASQHHESRSIYL